MNKKILSAIIAAALAVSPLAAFAQNDEPVLIAAPDVTAQQPEETQSAFAGRTMTVVSSENDTVVLKGETEDDTVNLTVSDSTLIINSKGEKVEELKADDNITYYIKGNKPALLIYPPVYTPDVIVVNDEENVSSVKVDTFKIEDGRLISSDGQLIVNADSAVIERADGGKVTKESLDGKDLCVIYSISTMSIPPQTNPDKVYILSTEEDANISEDIEEAINVTNKISSNGGEVFNIDIVTVNGRQMLPVRQISESLGLEVGYDQTVEAVTVGTIPMGVNFNIGKDEYNKARMAPLSLGLAPIKIIFEDNSGVTYVPVEFFTDVLGAEISVENDITNISFN